MYNYCVKSALHFLWPMLVLLLAPAVASGADVKLWSEWEKNYFERAGPGGAQGVLVYLHDLDQTHNDFGPIVLVDLARTMRWDLLRIKRQPELTAPKHEAEILAFVATEIRRLRQEGYRRIALAGQKYGAWLAVAGAGLDGVDAALAFAPLSDPARGGTLEGVSHRSALAHALAGSHAKRIALTESDGEAVDWIAEPLYRALRSSNASFALLQQTSLDDRPAIESGRFARRYRDCLIGLLSAPHPGSGEIRCNTSIGYAAGSDIPLEGSAPIVALDYGKGIFWPFVGIWAGDDALGDYVVLKSTRIDTGKIKFQVALSLGPRWVKAEPLTYTMTFRSDVDGRRLIHDDSRRDDHLRSLRPEVLEFTTQLPGQPKPQTFLLKPLRRP